MGKIQGVVKKILALAILYTSMKINNLHCKRAVDNATAALANLTDRDRAHGKQFTKACCVCDRFVPYGEEKALTLERLKEYKDCFKGTAADRAKKTYKVKCYNTNDAPYRFLRHMMLSPRSYKVKVGNRQEGLGCCKTCFGQVMRLKKDPLTLPTFAISNGWCIGTPPKCLTDLNEVERILVSPARINKHVFEIRGGQHQTMKGWHSMYYNDLSHFEAVEEHVQRLHKSPTISVIMAGPFTKSQKVLALERTTIDWRRIDYALHWLKRNNPLYQNFAIPAGDRVQPILVDER